MALPTGSRVGPYEVQSSLGAGGMGEVYRARDTKLNRDVAIKILPEAFAADPDRLARFTREAQTLAALNHPNIAQIHGLEESPSTGSGQAGIRALVMELVDGEDLSAVIARGPMAIADAIPLARQIADAIEAAHEHGIIHRDLKPANIKVRPDGTAKVLDFGLARALAPDTPSAADAMNSPTLSVRATQMGVILGTAAYMAPEQARGRPVDRRADIWAFGVVLYEMLSGRRAFEGDDVSITLASVLKEDVRWQALPPDLPAPVRRLLRRCLEKDPRRRLSAIGDARLELEEALSPSDPELAPATTPPAPAAVVPVWRRAIPWAIATAGLAAAVVSLAMWAPWRTTPVPTPKKLLVQLGADVSLPTAFGASAILSPDGTVLAFVGQRQGQALFVRKLDQLEATALGGTNDAANPFFSPDGAWIAFFAGGKLKKVSVTGGAPITLCDAPSGRGGTWTEDDAIIFTPNSASNVSLMRVPAAGGVPAPFGVLSKGATSQRWPQALPDGRGVLFSEHSSTGGWDGANLMVAPVTGGPAKVVVQGGYSGRFIRARRTASGDAVDRGHLVYMQQGTLFAVRFDLERLETIGQAVPALDGLAANSATAGAQIALSADGTLVYVPGSARSGGNPIDWMTRDGKTSPLRSTVATWHNPRFSPDGQKLALAINDGTQFDIWVYEWARDTLTQLTFDPGRDSTPVWSPDGRRIVFSSDRSKQSSNLYWMNADGSGDVHRLTDSPNNQVPFSLHPSGKFLAFQEVRDATSWDLMTLPLEGDPAGEWRAGKPTVFVSTPVVEVAPMFSPDGRWIAYFSNEAAAGTGEIYVRPFPGPGGKWRISTEEGLFPRWSSAARELLFLSRGRVMFATYSASDDSFRADRAQVWSPTGYVTLGLDSPYDLHPDGKRLAIVAATRQTEAGQNQVVFVFNFADHLSQIAPGSAP